MSLFSQSPSFSTRILTPLLSAAWPVPDVYEALVKAFTGAGKTVEEAQAHIEELKEEERYILEVYVILAVPLPTCHADLRLMQLLSNSYRAYFGHLDLQCLVHCGTRCSGKMISEVISALDMVFVAAAHSRANK